MKVMDKQLYEMDAKEFLQTFHKEYRKDMSSIQMDYLLMYLYETKRLTNKIIVTLADYQINLTLGTYTEVVITKNKDNLISFSYTDINFKSTSVEVIFNSLKNDKSDRIMYVKVTPCIFNHILELMTKDTPTLTIYEDDDFIEIDNKYLNYIKEKTFLTNEMNRLLSMYSEYISLESLYITELNTKYQSLVNEMNAISNKLQQVSNEIHQYFINNGLQVRKYERKKLLI